MRAIGVLLALAVGLSAGAAVAAPTVEYTPGQVFIYDNGRVEQVVDVEGERVTWAARSGRTYVRDANPVVPILEWRYRGQRGERRIVGDPDALWPLKPGARVSFRAVNIATDERTGRNRRSLHMWTCSVRGRERVQTPAGSFDALPIVCDRFSPSTMRVLERITWHFAPEVGHYVRRELRDMRSGSGEMFQLFAALPPRATNVVRIEALARRAAALHSEANPQTRLR